jgi:phage terminase small subunit
MLQKARRRRVHSCEKIIFPAHFFAMKGDKRKKPPQPKRSPSKVNRPSLSDLYRQDRFCREAATAGVNGTQAAIRAGYSLKTAYSTASALLKKPEIQEKIAKFQAEHAECAKIKAAEILAEIKNLAFSDIGDIVNFTPKGPKLKPMHELTPEARRCISSIKVRQVRKGGEIRGEVTEFKLWDKTGKLKELAQHLGLLVEKTETTLKGDPNSPLNIQAYVEGRKLAATHRAARVATAGDGEGAVASDNSDSPTPKESRGVSDA